MTTPGFRFSVPIGVRYSDLDAQGHMNHARYLTFMEEARFHYARALGLWTDVDDFNAVGQIVAEASCTYLRPVKLGQTVDVAVRTTRLGTKSLAMAYHLSVAGEPVATARTVQVAFDYHTHRSIPVPPAWRAAIAAFEGEALGA
jgi:acyl-CoA thioester hydrolase